MQVFFSSFLLYSSVTSVSVCLCLSTSFLIVYCKLVVDDGQLCWVLLPVLAACQPFVIYVFNCTTDWHKSDDDDDDWSSLAHPKILPQFRYSFYHQSVDF